MFCVKNRLLEVGTMCLLIWKRSCFFTGILLSLILVGCSAKYSIKSFRYSEYKGEINQHTRFIRGQRKQIFQMLTQEEAFQGLCPKGVVIAFKPARPYGVGTLIKTRIVHIFELIWTSRVEEVLPDKKIRIQFMDGFFAGGTEIWKLESVGEYTQVSHAIIVQPRGLLRKLAWILKVRSKHNNIVETLLDNLEKSLGNAL
jgi:hypothetical protein